MIQTKYRYLAKEKGYRSGMTRIKDAGVTVAGIIIMQSGGDSLEDIITLYPHISKESIKEALKYYEAHKEEIDRDIYALTHIPKGYRVGKNGILLKK